MKYIIKAQPGRKLNIPDSLQSHAESTGIKAGIPAEIIREKKDEEHQAWLEELRKGLEANTENHRRGLPTYFLTGKEAEDYDKQLKQMQQVYDSTGAFDIGDDVDAAYITAGKRPSSAYDVARYNQFQADAANVNEKGLIAAMFGADAATMGLIPALAGWTAGDFASKYGSEVLGKAGRWMDQRMGDPDSHAWETAGNIGGGLAGWIGGYNTAHKLLKPAAWQTLILTKGKIPNALVSSGYKQQVVNNALNKGWLQFEPYKPEPVTGNINYAYKNGGVLKGQGGLKPVVKVAKALNTAKTSGGEASRMLQSAQKATNRYFWDKGFEYFPEAFEGIEGITAQHFGDQGQLPFEIKEINFIPYNVTLPPPPVEAKPTYKMSPNEARHQNLKNAGEKHGQWLVDKILNKKK